MIEESSVHIFVSLLYFNITLHLYKLLGKER